jgi:hypothetical protein
MASAELVAARRCCDEVAGGSQSQRLDKKRFFWRFHDIYLWEPSAWALDDYHLHFSIS